MFGIIIPLSRTGFRKQGLDPIYSIPIVWRQANNFSSLVCSSFAPVIDQHLDWSVLGVSLCLVDGTKRKQIAKPGKSRR